MPTARSAMPGSCSQASPSSNMSLVSKRQDLMSSMCRISKLPQAWICDKTTLGYGVTRLR
jgi:hypothetical protein